MFTFNAHRQSACPPFSDLRTQTYSYISDWIEIIGDGAAVAVTLPIPGPGERELVDADVFFYLGEVQEALDRRGHKVSVLSPALLGNASFVNVFAQTALHELGHFLGLHHKMKHPSIMSYEDDRQTKLYDYDIKAIRHLYKD